MEADSGLVFAANLVGAVWFRGENLEVYVDGFENFLGQPGS